MMILLDHTRYELPSSSIMVNSCSLFDPIVTPIISGSSESIVNVAV